MSAEVTMVAQLKEMVASNPPEISFEFFPAKTDAAEADLHQVIQELAVLQPEFMSVTYGAGGTTKARTYETVRYIKENTNISPVAHLTCVNASKAEIDEVIQSYIAIGVSRIVALRGDAADMGAYTPHPEGYAYAHELVAGLCAQGEFDISVAAFPEVHPEATSPEADLAYLKEKLGAGASRAITQYCFDTDRIVRFIEKARSAGINKPIVPGIIPIHNFTQVQNFSQRCGAEVPDWLVKLFGRAEEEKQTEAHIALMVALEQCRLLMQHGITQFHFYTLNKAPLTKALSQILGAKKHYA